MKLRLLAAAGLTVAAVSCKTPAPQGSGLRDAPDAPGAAGGGAVTCTEKPIRPEANLGGMRHEICKVPVKGTQATKDLHVLTLKGTFKEVAYAHGYILSAETDRGVMAEMKPRVEAMIKGGSAPERILIKCLTNRMRDSVSKEFRDALDAFFAGYQKAAADEGRTPMIGSSEDDKAIFRTLALGVELENVSDGIMHRLQDKKLFEVLDPNTIANATGDAGKAVAEILSKCSMETRQEVAAGLINLKKKLFQGGSPNKFACTGFASPSQTSAGGRFLHARNLDSDSATSWNNEPVLFVVHEKRDDGTWMVPYAAPGSAGMFFMGGVGGFNAAGVSVALHQMYTNIYRIGENDGKADIGPFVTQKILREATSLEEGEAIVRGRQKHFGAWTEHIGDAKSDKIVSVEMSAAEKLSQNGVDVYEATRRRTGQWMAQSNHFFSAVTDAAYTPYFNKYLESRARFIAVEQALKKSTGQVDVDFAVDLLSGHYDPYEGYRSFGRTIAKVYGAMSHIMVPMKQKKTDGSGWPAVSEVWMTVGERVRPTGYTGDTDLYLSASHSTFAGFDIDWDQLKATPVTSRPSAIRTKQYDDLPRWHASLSIYIQARHTYVRGGDANKRKAVELLDQAIAEAERESMSDPRMQDMPHIIYYFIRARVNHELGEYAKAVADWDKLWPLYEEMAKPFFTGDGAVTDEMQHRRAYQAAAAALYSVVSKAKAGERLADAEEKRRLQFAAKVFGEEGLPEAQRARHYDLNRKLHVVKNLLQTPAQVPDKMQAIDFVFVE